ncbi:MAG: hypothetical protein DRN18_03295 [Thermoplasmata archaeon]|nr:MAG: hypothetical protein DRN18_03295 [Thermoplasmata archaeon]
MSKGNRKNYSDNVFINCPFDENYKPIFYAIVFTIHDCGFLPRCALEELHEIRLTKIEEIIEECKKRYKDKNRKFLVMDREEYRYRQFISDISGIDVRAHHNNPQEAVRIVRNWLRDVSRRTTIPSGRVIWNRYNEFREDLPSLCQEINLDEEELTFLDYSNLISEWLKERG